MTRIISFQFLAFMIYVYYTVVDDWLVRHKILDCYACLGTKKCLYYVIKGLISILPMLSLAKSRVSLSMDKNCFIFYSIQCCCASFIKVNCYSFMIVLFALLISTLGSKVRDYQNYKIVWN